MNDFRRGLSFVLGAVLLAVWASGPCFALVFSEIMYHPPGGLDDDLEFIEIYNDRAVFEDMSEWEFTQGIQYKFPAGTILGGKKYLVVAKNPAALEAAYGITGVYGPYEGRLDNAGERITLCEANEGVGMFSQAIVLTVRYNDNRPWPVSPDGTGHSLVLAKLGGNPEEGSSWAASSYIGGTPGGPDQAHSDPSTPETVSLVKPGDAGRYFKGTKEPSPGGGGDPTTQWTQINFNDDPVTTEWLDGPTGYGFSTDPSEMQSVRTELSDMRYSYLSAYARIPFTLTAAQINSFTELRVEVYYDDAFVLYLNGQRVGDSGNISGTPPAYNAPVSTATDYPAMTIDLTGQKNLLVVGKNVLAIQGHNTSLTSSDFVMSPLLTATAAATGGGDDPQARLLINELLANSDAPPGTDWVEIYNPGPVAVTLTNIYLSDDPDNLLKHPLPAGAVMQPGTFIAIREGTPPDGFPFGLDFRGETVFLTVATPGPSPEPIRVLDAVRYGVLEPEQTFGRYPDGSNNLGILASATFGAANSQRRVGDVVINEIMYNHPTKDERYDFVELYNRSAAAVSLAGWEFTEGISYTFGAVSMAPGAYIVVAKDPNMMAAVYGNLTKGVNLFGPYSGNLSKSGERIELSYPYVEPDPNTGQPRTYMIVADEVTYYEGGRWPVWADGMGSSMELRDPHSDNDHPDAWADSDERAKSAWRQYSFTIAGSDSQYTHDFVDVFEILLLNKAEILIDDVSLTLNGVSTLTNGGFESGQSPWRFLGNHVQSSVTTQDSRSGSRSLHAIATGHGDPGANRINQSISGTAGTVTFTFWAKWLRGSRYVLLRTSRQRSPVQPPRPAYSFALDMPVNLGTPGAVNTAYTANRGPNINEVAHSPTLPSGGQAITVTARVTDNDGVAWVRLYYRSEGASSFSNTLMRDNGSSGDAVAGDSLYTARIPAATGGTMRAFYIVASDGSATTRFPTPLPSTADVPDRTCLVRVGDAQVTSPFKTYRVWLSNDVIAAFTSRPNLSNELMDCTFVYNDQEVFYNTKIRFRGSPFIRSGSGRNPTGRYAFRIDFPPDQKFRNREEINLDNTEGTSRGAVQERASYWFYNKMGMQYSRQEYVRWVANGNNYSRYEDVQKGDGEYIDAWFAADSDGYLHKVDDYFEYTIDGTGFANLDEGLIYNSQHPLLKETYRWGFEKRSHRQNDEWSHLLNFAQKMNTSVSSGLYELNVESVVHPEHLARSLAIRHAVGDWDSYGYRRGKNNMFYYTANEQKWYLLPWDIDFTLGSGNGPTSDLFEVTPNKFPEIVAFINRDKYRRMYLAALAELAYGPWQTSYGTANPPTAFDKFLDDAADQQVLDNGNDGRRNAIKAFIRDRRNYILTQLPTSEVFAITTNGGQDFCTGYDVITLTGVAPVAVSRIAVNGTLLPTELFGQNTWKVDVTLDEGANVLHVTGHTGAGFPVGGAEDTITVTKAPPSRIDSVTPEKACDGGVVDVLIRGANLSGTTQVSLTKVAEEIGFDAMHVLNASGFDRIEAATLLLDNPQDSLIDEIYSVYNVINLGNLRGQGEFKTGEQPFTWPFNLGFPNFAIRFMGYIYAPSPGTRYFGVCSDDGFALWIDGRLVGEYANLRTEATTDVANPGTAGTMSYDFPSEGAYALQMDYFFTDGQEGIELFQTDAGGGNRRLINVDAELVVYRSQAARINAMNISATDPNTVSCRFNLAAAPSGLWNLELVPECGPSAQCRLPNAMQVVSCRADIDGNKRVDFRDWAMLAGRWLDACSPPDYCSGADLDESGGVEMEDVAILAEAWLMDMP